MKLRSISIILMLLLFSAALFSGIGFRNTHATSPQYFGFWLQEYDVINTYTPSQFVSQYFGTPPYPALLEWMTFGPVDDRGVGACGGVSAVSCTNRDIAYLVSLAADASVYPNVHILVEVAFNMNTQMGLFNDYIGNLSGYSSIYAIGVEGEYASNQNSGTFQTACSDVTGAGLQFVSYYTFYSSACGGSSSTHTNFPNSIGQSSYDQLSTILDTGSSVVGIDSGYYYYETFPSTMTCPIGASASNNATNGWNSCVVDTALYAATHNVSSANREFVAFTVGFWGQDGKTTANYFTDSGGISTYQLWDNPTLRNWIWNDPNYQPNFINSFQQTTQFTQSTTTTITLTTTITTTSTTTLPTTTGTATSTSTTTVFTTVPTTITSSTCFDPTVTITQTSTITVTSTVTGATTTTVVLTDTTTQTVLSSTTECLTTVTTTPITTFQSSSSSSQSAGVGIGGVMNLIIGIVPLLVVVSVLKLMMQFFDGFSGKSQARKRD